MSGIVAEKRWHIGRYTYPFYRYVLEQQCRLDGKTRVLDAGCGNLVSSLPWFPENTFFVGVDINRENLLESHSKNHDFNYLQASVAALPFKEEAFDLVVSCDVLEHVEEKEQAVDEAMRVCRVGGKFAGCTSNMLNPVLFFDCYAPRSVAYKLMLKFSGRRHYDRHSRFHYAKIVKVLWKAGFNCRVGLYGFPTVYPILYHYNKRKPDFLAYCWVALDKMFCFAPLRLLKEMLVFCCVKCSF